ncbi:MAG: transcriptional regulator [Gammaproteobacteria bacterium]|nr:transcriptional regulator [Gammaproteobacteria bacterium]
MGILSSIKNLFKASGENPAEVEAEEAIEYKGFNIVPTPLAEGGQFRVAATISKPQDETEAELKTHQLIRSDIIPSRDECISISVRKAKMMIDQQGDGIFG